MVRGKMCWRAYLLIVLAIACCAARAEKDSADEKIAKSHKANVVFDRMVSFPEDGETDVILLRNIGGKTADLKGWWLSDSRKDKSNPEATYFFGKTRGCGGYRKIPAGGVLELTPYLKSNPCGFPFGVSIEEELHLFDDEDELVAHAAWDWSLQGLVMRRLPDGSYKRFQENKKTMNVLHDMEDADLFIEALKGAGLYEDLYAESAKDGEPLPDFPFKSPNEVIPFQLAEAAGKKSKKSSKWPVKDQTARFDGVPSDGPFTILAPTSDAIEEFLETWEPAEGLDKWEVFKLPEFKEIMEYHILPGSWMSGWVFDNLPISTSAGKDLVAFKGENTDGDILFHESCHDEESPGKYTCKEQKELGLCEQTTIKDNDFCQKTCGGCACTDGSCAKVVQADIYGTNGFVHVIDKVLVPGKSSKKKNAKKPKESPDSSDVKSDNKEDEDENDEGDEVEEEDADEDDQVGIEDVDVSDIQDVENGDLEGENEGSGVFDEDEEDTQDVEKSEEDSEDGDDESGDDESDEESKDDEQSDSDSEDVDDSGNDEESDADSEDADDSGDDEESDEDSEGVDEAASGDEFDGEEKDEEEFEADSEEVNESVDDESDEEEKDEEEFEVDSEDVDESVDDESDEEEKDEEEFEVDSEDESGDDEDDVQDGRVREDEDAELEKSEPFSLLTKPEESDEEDEAESTSTLESEESSSEETEAEEEVAPQIVDSNGLKTKRRRRANPDRDEANEEEDSDKSKKPISQRAARRTALNGEFPTGL